MKQLIQILKNSINLKVYANHTEDLGECIVYNFHTLLNDKIKKHYRLQITIIAETMEKSLIIEDEVNAALLTLGDDPLTADILQVKQNGGGYLEDIERKKHHRILYYDVIMR